MIFAPEPACDLLRGSRFCPCGVCDERASLRAGSGWWPPLPQQPFQGRQLCLDSALAPLKQDPEKTLIPALEVTEEAPGGGPPQADGVGVTQG